MGLVACPQSAWEGPYRTWVKPLLWISFHLRVGKLWPANGSGSWNKRAVQIGGCWRECDLQQAKVPILCLCGEIGMIALKWKMKVCVLHSFFWLHNRLATSPTTSLQKLRFETPELRCCINNMLQHSCWCLEIQQPCPGQVTLVCNASVFSYVSEAGGILPCLADVHMRLNEAWFMLSKHLEIFDRIRSFPNAKPCSFQMSWV